MTRSKREEYVLIGAVARRFGVHPQTLRLYEREGLIRPARSSGNTRLYDLETVERLEIILTLTRDLGVNLAGVEVILDLKSRLAKMEGEVSRLVEAVRAVAADHAARGTSPNALAVRPRGAIVLKVRCYAAGGTLRSPLRPPVPLRDNGSVRERRRPEDDSRVLRKYLEDIARYSTLTPERERELGRVIQDDGTPEDARRGAIDELVRGNLRFVVSYAKRFHSPEVSFLDLINEGNIGLIQAAKRFDPDRGVKFITYAVWWVRQAISHALSEQSGALRLPHKQATLHSRLGRVKEALSRSLGREATLDEIALEAGLEPDDVVAVLSLSRNAESLSDALGSEEDRTLEDTLVQTTVAAADEELVKRSSIEQTRDMLGALPPKERKVLCRRFGIPEDGSDGELEPKTLQEIGEELKLSRERVRQIEAQAIARLKRTMKSRALKAYLN